MIVKHYHHYTPPQRRKLPPGTRTLVYQETAPSTPLAETAPELPPGTDLYYYWGQSKPLSQQP
jgi:hypothetical protein